LLLCCTKISLVASNKGIAKPHDVAGDFPSSLISELGMDDYRSLTSHWLRAVLK
jgi:hypothetical protein